MGCTTHKPTTTNSPLRQQQRSESVLEKRAVVKEVTVSTASASSSGDHPSSSSSTQAGDGKKKKIWVTIKEQYELVEYQALPDYLRDNEYILKYYRADWPLKHTLLSIFSVHNETLNIWTHLVGFAIFLALTIYAAVNVNAPSSNWERLPSVPKFNKLQEELVMSGSSSLSLLMPRSSSSSSVFHQRPGLNASHVILDESIAAGVPVAPAEFARWPFFVFLLGAMTCLLTSSTSHLLSCHSRSVSSLMWRLDYAGIAVMIATSFYPPIYYVFHCQPLWQFVYLAGITLFGIGAVFVTVIPCLHSPKFRIFRTMLFVSMGLSGVIPGAHAVVQNWNMPMCFVVLGYELAMVVFYLSGTLVYAARIPERWKPGFFDIAGHSHQIFHVMVILGAYAHYKAALVVMEWRASTIGC
ncbi:heptahelical transmembrane protein ADIPOR1 [Selaginella moellendorffii]|uniref:heptahelical transmembrane protein ADIPOR1 n=1 Tax=Selaginella moellendorffii TaxID=88036 RepID=UPI000D1C5FC1|nr:heptahelical transmembrane protein ADIPOR1 [Selaginella moellendorffii]XP_024535181.1 heptahelical transmembrane protein ADIPOR1 [Selaginella moellendorffii]|eukprot:XP_024521850.1 heptahelical transmembrane protein ADIPOR1 [Selaginella moellendorffii]